MQLKPKQVNFYNWNDIEPHLHRHMGVAKEFFRDYHKVVHPDYDKMPISNRPYYDFWHVWLEFWGENIRNDTYVRTWFDHVDDDEAWDRTKENVTKKYGEWAILLVDGVRSLQREQGWGTGDEEAEDILIWYSW